VADVIDLTLPENRITAQLMDSLVAVHKALGPGLLESVYEKCLCHELRKRNLNIREQVALPLHYDNLIFDSALRLDLVIEDQIIVELKSVDMLLPVHKAQLLSYLRLSGMPVGFLVNFNVPLIKDGVRRFHNKLRVSASPCESSVLESEVQ
jgi:GxxExxY protein